MISFESNMCGINDTLYSRPDSNFTGLQINNYDPDDRNTYFSLMHRLDPFSDPFR